MTEPREIYPTTCVLSLETRQLPCGALILVEIESVDNLIPLSQLRAERGFVGLPNHVRVRSTEYFVYRTNILISSTHTMRVS